MRLSLDGLWVGIAILLPALVALLVPMPAVDLAYQVRAGNEILRTGAIPAVDTWTFTVWGTAWLDQQWLAQVVLAIGQQVGGWELLAVIRAVLVALTTGLLVATARVVGVAARSVVFFGAGGLRSGAMTIVMLRPSRRGDASILASEPTWSATPWSTLAPSSGWATSRPRNCNVTLTL